MYDLIVIGGGFWGSATALYAKDNGYDKVLVIDNADPLGASRNAACIIDLPSYRKRNVRKLLPKDWTFKQIAESMGWLNTKVGIGEGIYFSSYVNPTVRFRRNIYYIQQPSTLTDLVSGYRIIDDIQDFHKNGDGWVIHSQHNNYETKALVVAVGFRTDSLLMNSGYQKIGVEGMEGTALIIEKEKYDEIMDIPIMHMFRPYVSFMIRTYGDDLRFGDTTPKIDKDGYMESCLKHFLHRNYKVKKKQVGYRPVVTNGKMVVKKLDDNLVVITGGHRVGLALCGLVAKKAIELIN